MAIASGAVYGQVVVQDGGPIIETRPAPTPAPDAEWINVYYARQLVEHCPIRVAIDVSTLFNNDREVKAQTGIANYVRCEDAYVPLLKLRRFGSASLGVTPAVILPHGLDQLAIFHYEVWQGDQKLGGGRDALQADEGETNWGDESTFSVRWPVADGPPVMLRVEVAFERR
jgi:hypothetical protein